MSPVGVRFCLSLSGLSHCWCVLWDYSRFKSVRSGKLVFGAQTKLFALNVRKCLTGLCLWDSETNIQDRGDFKMKHLTHYSQCWQNRLYYWSFRNLHRVLVNVLFVEEYITFFYWDDNHLIEWTSDHPYWITYDPSHCNDLTNVWYSWLNNCTFPGETLWDHAFILSAETTTWQRKQLVVSCFGLSVRLLMICVTPKVSDVSRVSRMM